MATRALSDDDASEASLIEAARAGDARAFEALLRRHEARVLRVLRLLGVPVSDREDVAQNVFLRLFRGLDGFQKGRPFASWVYKVSANAALDWRGQSDQKRREEAPWDDAVEETAPASLSAADRLDLARRLEGALETLTERERAVFVLIEMEGLDRDEAARVLGITAITIRRHLGLAKDRLRQALQEKKIPAR
ncbi:MAG TPA: RNA polymerase sigma factor [Candidatus Polarisedimenticolaceae bacterium]|nr:RNA polymerase sigma factor [Candidatus Polarisedimenticolaceae bacterium]